MTELSTIIKQLKEAAKENNVEITGNCLFENAVKIYISDRINESKNKEPREIPLENEKETDPNAPTDKQIRFLKRNKISTEGKTKIECTKIIKEIIEKSKEGEKGGRGFKS